MNIGLLKIGEKYKYTRKALYHGKTVNAESWVKCVSKDKKEAQFYRCSDTSNDINNYFVLSEKEIENQIGKE